MLKATERYQEESDQLSDFLAERCELGASRSVSTTALYRGYADWASCNRSVL